MSYFATSDEKPDWIGRLPDGWTSGWLKWSANLSTQRPNEKEGETLPYISNEHIESWTGKLLIENADPSESDGRKFSKDDVLFNKLRPYLAKVYQAEFNGISSGELLCLTPSNRLHSRFLFYVTSSRLFVDAVNLETFGSKMPRADWEIVGHQPLPLPPIETQKKIAAFLDEKTAQIDGLIEKKHALLKRLAEKRQALITQAVTKGLNPNAPMKDSGIDWLGQVPEHWGVKLVKHVAKLESGHTPSRQHDEYWEETNDIPWVSLNDTALLRKSDYISDTTFKINELGLANSSARMLPERAVVFTRDATIGECAITTKAMAVSQHIIAWLCDHEVLIPEYLLFSLYGMKGELLRLTNGSTIGTIGLSDVKSLGLVVPPIAEQETIIAHVVGAKEDIDSCATDIAKSIEKLEEYRAALISSAVTGKLDGLQ
jgi:type I restriction enzyme S subunit